MNVVTESSSDTHIGNRLEPQVLEYVEVTNPTTRAQLLHVISKFEEIYSVRETQGSSKNYNERRKWDARWKAPNDSMNRNWRDAEVLDDYVMIGEIIIKIHTGIDPRGTRDLSESFNQGDRRHGGHRNCLRVHVDQNDQSQIEVNPSIMLSALCLSPLEPPYVPILLNETFTRALWDAGAEKSFISEKVYKKNFFYKPVKKSQAEVMTAQVARDICEPLYQFKRKLRKFSFSEETQVAFKAIKRTITKGPVLKLPDFYKPFRLFTDASSIDITVVLNQEQRPTTYASRMLNNAERNYTVTERECLAVIWALNKFHNYLGLLPVKVITDHAALIKLTHGKNLSSRMIRWVLKLEEFNVEWEHSPGTQNVVADILSRNPVENKMGEYVARAVIRDWYFRPERY
ncbi:retrovirus-related Pol polyprotein from transposon 17.6 [Trichonephila clavipes]|nr:retrovirus-related Pol polyprotein from transposon 17.6 [Trichonephila clavipes]